MSQLHERFLHLENILHHYSVAHGVRCSAWLVDAEIDAKNPGYRDCLGDHQSQHRNRKLLSLTSRHPTARIDNSHADYLKAEPQLSNDSRTPQATR